jgi:trehalose 6-phosphate phosphatase
MFFRVTVSAPTPSHAWCLFLDVDGTLLELADTPAAVAVDDALKDLLVRVAETLCGAMALVSGRSIGVLDRLFAPLELPAAGLHGLERRTASGQLHAAAPPDARLEAARAGLAAFVDAHPGTLLEDKGGTLALHYRMAPHFAETARRVMDAAVRALPGFHVQEGKMVLEIKPREITKATAVAAFMRESPFAGRTPVFVGYDVTDRDGLSLVERMGGISIAVGDQIRGQWRLESPAEVRRWLASVAALG